jgi:hypothetical protein
MVKINLSQLIIYKGQKLCQSKGIFLLEFLEMLAEQFLH